MTKQEKIKEAYGKDYDVLLPNENGWSTKVIMYQDVDFEKYDIDAVAHGLYMVRLKSLEGIETNNGWIKIESEDDLPKEYYGIYHVISRQNIYCNEPKNQNTEDYWQNDINKKAFWLENFTHYQPITKREPPIY